jgi:hypothetical protein
MVLSLMRRRVLPLKHGAPPSWRALGRGNQLQLYAATRGCISPAVVAALAPSVCSVWPLAGAAVDALVSAWRPRLHAVLCSWECDRSLDGTALGALSSEVLLAQGDPAF